MTGLSERILAERIAGMEAPLNIIDKTFEGNLTEEEQPYKYPLEAEAYKSPDQTLNEYFAKESLNVEDLEVLSQLFLENELIQLANNGSSHFLQPSLKVAYREDSTSTGEKNDFKTEGWVSREGDVRVKITSTKSVSEGGQPTTYELTRKKIGDHTYLTFSHTRIAEGQPKTSRYGAEFWGTKKSPNYVLYSNLADRGIAFGESAALSNETFFKLAEPRVERTFGFSRTTPRRRGRA